MTHPNPESPPAEPASPFTPVPTRPRHDGWSPDRQLRFVHALATLGSVYAAARAVGSTRTSAYRLRQRAGAESFAQAWDAALSNYRAERFDLLFQRAMDGVIVPRRYRGAFVGVRHLIDNDAALALLSQPKVPPHLRRRVAQR